MKQAWVLMETFFYIAKIVTAYPAWVIMAQASLLAVMLSLGIIFYPNGDTVSASKTEPIQANDSGNFLLSTFREGECFIVIGGHHDQDVNLWEDTGLIGTSDALAAGRILGALNSSGITDCHITTAGSLSGSQMGENLILIGGPDANTVTKAVSQKISNRIKFGDPDRHVLTLEDTASNSFYNPERSGNGRVIVDHGLIIVTDNPFNPRNKIHIVAGSFGHGTFASAIYLSDALASPSEEWNKSQNFELLVRTDVVNSWPQYPVVVKRYPI